MDRSSPRRQPPQLGEVLHRCYTLKMPTQKHRISITPDETVYAALSILSRRRKRAVSSVALDLVTKAIELEEDLHFSRVADQRLSKKEKRLVHERAWR